jgi:hypothetical protein
MRNAIAFVMAVLLAAPNVSAANPPSQARIKEQVLLINSGSPVEVRLFAKGKLKGRLGLVSDNGFALDLVKDGKIQTQTVSFADVRSIKKDKSMTPMSSGSKALWMILILGIAAGAIAGIGCAAGGCGSG